MIVWLLDCLFVAFVWLFLCFDCLLCLLRLFVWLLLCLLVCLFVAATVAAVVVVVVAVSVVVAVVVSSCGAPTNTTGTFRHMHFVWQAQLFAYVREKESFRLHERAGRQNLGSSVSAPLRQFCCVRPADQTCAIRVAAAAFRARRASMPARYARVPNGKHARPRARAQHCRHACQMASTPRPSAPSQRCPAKW